MWLKTLCGYQNLSGKHAFDEFKWQFHKFKWLYFKWLYFKWLIVYLTPKDQIVRDFVFYCTRVIPLTIAFGQY